MKKLSFVLIIFCLIFPTAAIANVSVKAAVEHQDVFVGEPFLFQIQVEGDDSPEEPDLSVIKGFDIVARGGQQNNSQSITIINGKMSKVSSHGYIFNYQATAKTEGRQTIPSIKIKAAGKDYYTNPVVMLVKKPEETSDFKLRLQLEKDKAYVGEPVKLTLTWYVGTDVKDIQFNLPMLSDPRFNLRKITDEFKNASQENLIRIVLGNEETLAVKGSGRLAGKEYLTVSFSRYIFFKEPGEITIPQATVSCQGLTGYQQRSHDPFAGFFNDSFSRDFFGRSRGVYRTFVVPSNEPKITVRPLPEQGRPPGFDGLVGEYSIAVNANPLEVKVGDPITLTIQVAGPFVEDVDLDFFKGQLASQDFKIPEEMAPGVSEGILKTFTQTVRARHAGVKEIPSIKISFFKPSSGRYEVAGSSPVALQVKGARLVTAQDAEGTEFSLKKEVKALKGGINFNYEGADILENQAMDSSLGNMKAWYAVLCLPPIFYLIFFTGLSLKKHRQKDPERRGAKKALKVLVKKIQTFKNDQQMGAKRWEALGDGLREYLGAKLLMNPAAIIYADVESKLLKAGVPENILSDLKDILSQCEAFRYAGGAAENDFDSIAAKAEDVIKKLDSYKI